jgi:SAM-dependent methyltransferase
VLTVDMDYLGLTRGDLVLDLGAGRGRHSFEAAKRGARVVALDLNLGELREVQGLADAMARLGECSPRAVSCIRGDALRLPFPDAAFDRVIASEVLEHIEDDRGAMSEIARVLKPRGRVAVTVPRWWPERLCWGLSRGYRNGAGGHVRIYRRTDLTSRLSGCGFRPVGAHHAHALHSPYWWLKCLWGLDNEHARLPSLYHRFLVWDITTRPRITRALERTLNPIMGKSLVMYLKRDAR